METVKIAVPTAQGKLTVHFGHCSSFAFVVADKASGKALGREDLVPPPHEPGILPRWLAEKGVNVIIAGGMGGRASQLFAQQGITVITGAPCLEPEELVEHYLTGKLETGVNGCDH